MCSLLPYYLQEVLLCKPLYQVFYQALQEKPAPCPVPKGFNLMLNALQGSKLAGSKCKVWRYYLLAEELEDVFLAQGVCAALRKAITSGKAGEAALKLFPDGTFICPLDTIADNLKMVEEAINAAGAKDKFTVGLGWQADLFYNPDTKKY